MKVSVIIPCVEDRGFLKEAIASAQNQDGFTLNVDYEIIVVQSDARLGENINEGVSLTCGEYIKILADDDLLTPNCLKDLCGKMDEGYDIVCANAINMMRDGNVKQKSVLPRTVRGLAMHNTIHGGTTMYRRSAMPEWNEKMWTAEEYDLHLRMAAMGLRFGYVDSIVYKYRVHDKQKSGNGIPWYKDPDTGQRRFDYIFDLQDRYRGNYSLIKT